jgi:hypothetical protein
MRNGDRAAKARSLVLADHAARCTCAGPCELSRVILRDAELDHLARAAGRLEIPAAGLAPFVQGALTALELYNAALRRALGERGLFPPTRKTTTRRRWRSKS